ncbi:hypothetical protein ACHAWF_010566 [Thalassiosira exigua]
MRMGRSPPKRRKSSRTKAPPGNKPKFSSSTMVVGRIDPRVVESVYAPMLTDLAVASAEAYAEEALAWEQATNGSDAEMGAEGSFASEEEVELDLDGNVVAEGEADAGPAGTNSAEASAPPPRPRLFSAQADVDELTSLLSDVSVHFSHPGNQWKVHANAAKFERLLDEKYGRWRPFIENHPEVEIFVKNVQRKYAMGGMSPFKRKEDMPVSKSTAVIMLFMMQRQGVRMEALILAACFCLVGLQPWALVALVALGKWEADRRRGRRIHGMPKKLTACEPYYARDASDEKQEEEEDDEEERKRKHAFLTRPVGTKFDPADLTLRDEKRDVLLLGSGIDVLYCAALLARAGRKVCVLSPADDVAECATIAGGEDEGAKKFEGVPFDAKAYNVANWERQQRLLAPALCTVTDVQGGIRFARVGSAADGYAHSILSLPELDPVVVNGAAALAEHCANYMGDGRPGVDAEGKDDGNSVSLGYLKACQQIHAASGQHFLTKIFKAAQQLKSDGGGNAYRAACLRTAAPFLDRSLPYYPWVRALMAALGGANENSPPSRTCMAAHASHVCAMTGEDGVAYPVGGPRALGHALASVVEQCGGRVVRGVELQELVFDEVETKEAKETKKSKKEEGGGDATSADAGPKPRCRGVRLRNGCEVGVSDDGSVASFVGLVPTFLHLVPTSIRDVHGVPPGLPAVSERRPFVKIIVGLDGTAEELELTGADWYRLPNATVPRDEADGEGGVTFGTIGEDSEDNGDSDGGAEEGEATATGGSGERRGKQSKASAAKPPRRTKFTGGHSWMKVLFPSAKDPSWRERHGNVSTCVITVEADDDLVRVFDTKPKIYSVLKDKSGEMGRLVDRALKDLLENFPQLAGKVACVQARGPIRSGLVQDPVRFAASGNRPASPYPGLYVGGPDLTISDSFSGAIASAWLVANAVAGYTGHIDHTYLGKSLTSDLERFLDEPCAEVTDRTGRTIEDLAVPCDLPTAETKEKPSEKKEAAVAVDVNTNAAESSKEE